MINRLLPIANRFSRRASGFTRNPSPITFLNAQVLGPDGVAASSLRIERGRVAALNVQPRPGDCVIDLDGAVVSPGLINAHDHLELNNFPRLKWRERYANASEWIADFQPRFDSDPALAGPRAILLDDRLLIGALKNLLSGVTTVCHHNPLYASLRNGYPVRIATDYRFSHSLLIDGEKAVAREYRRTPGDWPWIIHCAEGTDEEAAGELSRLDRLGCLGPNTVVVHGVGLTAGDRLRLIERGGGLVWCPSSNQFTLGATADVRALANAGRVALGSDSRLSGGRDLLAEMKTARAANQVDAKAIFRMVTSDAANVMRLRDAGRLSVGVPADLVILPLRNGDVYENLLRADRADVRLVMVGGRPLYGDAELLPVLDALRVESRRVCVDGYEKRLSAKLVDRLRRSSIQEAGLEILE
jgi:cytosine/adenosine deaminase-related metal-dependent hydrolase